MRNLNENFDGCNTEGTRRDSSWYLAAKTMLPCACTKTELQALQTQIASSPPHGTCLKCTCPSGHVLNAIELHTMLQLESCHRSVVIGGLLLQVVEIRSYHRLAVLPDRLEQLSKQALE